MTILFHESVQGGIPGNFNSVGTLFGLATATLDTNNEVIGTNSIKYSNTGEGGAAAVVDLGSEITEMFVKFSGRLAPGFSFGSASYSGLLNFLSGNGANLRISLNMEDYGTPRLTFSQDVGYTDTGIDLPIDEVFTLQIQIIKNVSTGRIRVWLNNDVEGSPDFDSGNVNTGATGVDTYSFGKTYVPETVSDYFLDEFYIADAFIPGPDKFLLQENTKLLLQENGRGIIIQ